MAKNTWLEIDKEGMAQIVRRRGPAFLPMELLGNCLDTDAKNISIEFRAVPGRPVIEVRVEDDDPKGFADLTDAYTLYKPSIRRGDPNKRGRFNIGEKEVLALCESAVIVTTSGTIVFHKDGMRLRKNRTSEVGTIFQATVKMTREEAREAFLAVKNIIPPEGVKIVAIQDGIIGQGHEVDIYSDSVERPKAIGQFTVSLPTELEDGEGNLRPTRRQTLVAIYQPRMGEVPMLYEMGIPVCELSDDKWHIDVQQKIPLPRDRDSVRPNYLHKLRVAVLNNLHSELAEEDAAKPWVQEAAGDKDIDRDALDTVLTHQFGDDRVSASPRDPEAAKRAASNGVNVMHGGAVSADVWNNIRRHDLVESAEVKFGTSNPEFSIDGIDCRIPRDDWTKGMVLLADYAADIGEALLGFRPTVQITRDMHNRKFHAWYGSRSLTINLSVCGHKWFNSFPANMDEVNDLLIHEFGHHFSGDHLSSEYHDALTRLGAKMVRLALDRPEMFQAGG